MSGVPGKIVLKSTTKISLTERFAGIRQNTSVYEQNAQRVKALRPTATLSNGTGFRGPLGASNGAHGASNGALGAANGAPGGANLTNGDSPHRPNYMRERVRNETQMLQRNMRQSQYMSQRPAVVTAAMKLKQRSIRTRLGTPNPVNGGDVYSRLSMPVRSRLGRVPNANSAFDVEDQEEEFPSRNGGGFPSRNRAGFQFPSRNGGFGGFRGRGRGRGGFRGRGARGFSFGSRIRGGYRGRGGFRGSFRRGGGGLRGGGGGLRGGGRGRGRGGFRGRGARPKVSREALDEQLDQYMSKSKMTLDSELDAYMAAADE